MISINRKMIFAISCIVFTVFMVGLSHEAFAEVQYVSDMLIISVREGQNPEDPALGYLPSATPVDVLEETDELMRIRTDDGLEGWVRKKFIIKDKPKAIIIQELNQQIEELENNLQNIP